MLGAIAGDIIGSVYEGKKAWQEKRTPHFEPLFAARSCFTDDTVLSVAVAESILHGGDLVDLFKEYACTYPSARVRRDVPAVGRVGRPGTIQQLGQWSGHAESSPVGFAYNDLDEVLLRSRWTAEVTHNHPDAIKGAQAIAAAVCLARTGSSKERIRDYIERKFGYDLSTALMTSGPGSASTSHAGAPSPPP